MYWCLIGQMDDNNQDDNDDAQVCLLSMSTTIIHTRYIYFWSRDIHTEIYTNYCKESTSIRNWIIWSLLMTKLTGNPHLWIAIDQSSSDTLVNHFQVQCIMIIWMMIAKSSWVHNPPWLKQAPPLQPIREVQLSLPVNSQDFTYVPLVCEDYKL